MSKCNSAFFIFRKSNYFWCFFTKLAIDKSNYSNFRCWVTKTMTILDIWRINIGFQTPKKFFQLPYFINGHLQLWLEYFVFQCYCVVYIVHDCFLVFPFFEAYLQVVLLLTNVSCFLKPCIMWFTWCHFQTFQRTYQRTKLIQKQ